MATLTTPHTSGHATPPRPQTAGAVHVARAVLDLTDGMTAATDTAWLTYLPPDARIVDATLVPRGTFTGLTADIGLVDGATIGTELFAAVGLSAGVQRLAAEAAFRLAPAETARTVGLSVSGNVAAAADQSLTLLLFYTQ